MSALDDLGIPHWRGVRVEFERQGKKRLPEPVEYPSLPNYVWLWPDHHQIHQLRDVKHLAHTMRFLTDADVRAFGVFRAAADARHAEAMRIVGNRAAICEYRQGERLIIADGPLAGMLATFSRMVQASDFAHVEAEVEIFGALVPTVLDPLSVKKAV